ncbi:MAG: hypothetical protein LBV60_10185 [Streptomyces sp.]|nr:hypothetical protein [Streptomyces sp.]
MSGDFALLRRFDPAGLRESAGRWRRRADEWHLPVADDGTVGLPPQAEPDRHDPDARDERQNQVQLRNQVQDRINASLTAAREASDQGAHALGRLGADVLTQPRVFGAAAESAKDVQDVAKDLGLAAPYIPENKDPKQSAEWWKSLTPEQQQSCIALHPEEIGRLDGLPATVRDQANRLVVEQQLDTLKAGNAKGSGITYEEWNQRQTNLHALKEALDKGDAADEVGPDRPHRQAAGLGGKGGPGVESRGDLLTRLRRTRVPRPTMPRTSTSTPITSGPAPQVTTTSASSPERPSGPTPPSVPSVGRPSASTPTGTAATGTPTARA